ncbi:MAG: paraquat-inducible protein A [Chthoniobacter sp.]|uniref:paraquat-inducible protein A n=1 Tax=Chthoniobacter sp. TaxID=2510640 RepID=UPI0032ACB356
MGSPVFSLYLACPDCDGLYTAPELPEGDRVVCPRCQAHLVTRRADFVSRATALVLAAALFFVLANLFPFMTLKADYRESDMLLAGSVTGLEQQGFPILTGMVGMFMLVAPALVIGALLYLLLPLRNGRRLRGALHVCRAMEEARRWNMIEVYLLGVLVSLLKLEKLATLTLGVSFWAFVGLIVCLAFAVSIVDPAELWKKLEEAQP